MVNVFISVLLVSYEPWTFLMQECYPLFQTHRGPTDTASHTHTQTHARIRPFTKIYFKRPHFAPSEGAKYTSHFKPLQKRFSSVSVLTRFIRTSSLSFGQKLRTKLQLSYGKGQEYAKFTIQAAPKWTKIKNICSGSNFEKLRTFEAHPIFTGSYKK